MFYIIEYIFLYLIKLDKYTLLADTETGKKTFGMHSVRNKEKLNVGCMSKRTDVFGTFESTVCAFKI